MGGEWRGVEGSADLRGNCRSHNYRCTGSLNMADGCVSGRGKVGGDWSRGHIPSAIQVRTLTRAFFVTLTGRSRNRFRIQSLGIRVSGLTARS